MDGNWKKRERWIVNILARIKKGRAARTLAVLAALAVSTVGMSFAPAEAATAAAAGATVANELAKPNEAQAQLAAQAEKMKKQEAKVAVPASVQEAAKNADVKANRLFVPVESVVVKSFPGMTEEQLKGVIPEATKKMVSIHKLSKQIQFLNDGGAMRAHADFQRGTDGYVLTLTAEKVRPEQGAVTVTNTGNDYTGNYRVTTSYVNRNLSHHADTLGVAYVTSPSGGHVEDVKQAALAYRMPIAKSSDALTLTASYSDVDLDLSSALSGSGIDMGANGKGTTLGLHYQRNLAYTSHEKDGWDLGVNYWKMKNAYDYRVSGSAASSETDYDVTTASLTYYHNDRDARHSFSYQAGVETSLSVGGDYEAATTESDKSFQLFKAGMNYSYRTPSDWIFGLRWNSQYTNKNLVSCMQLGAGGRTTVRGFMERAIAADRGILGSFEIYTPQFAPGSRFVLFCDAAHLENHNDTAAFDNQTIASYGIGYRYQAKNLNVAIDYAGILKDLDDEFDQQHKRWNFLVSWMF